VLKFIFPRASRANGWTLWGMDYDAWSDFQTGLLGTIFLAILFHIMLHWNWVCGVIAVRFLGRSGKVDEGLQTLYGVGTLIVLLLATTGLLIAAEFTIRPPPHP
jgi:hypothetical protein